MFCDLPFYVFLMLNFFQQFFKNTDKILEISCIEMVFNYQITDKCKFNKFTNILFHSSYLSSSPFFVLIGLNFILCRNQCFLHNATTLEILCAHGKISYL